MPIALVVKEDENKELMAVNLALEIHKIALMASKSLLDNVKALGGFLSEFTGGLK